MTWTIPVVPVIMLGALVFAVAYRAVEFLLTRKSQKRS